MALELAITNEQKIRVTVAPKTATGKPANLDGRPAWTIVDGASTLDVAEDGLSAFLISSDQPGSTSFLVQADADLGGGIVEISDIIVLQVNGAQAASLGLASESAVPK